MRFYVIYSFDIPYEDSVKPWTPRRVFKLQTTERHDGADGDYDYLGDNWTKSKHRKYVGFLSKAQLRQLCWDMGFRPEETETMGSLTEYGWLPAISFNAETEYYDVIGNMYVTPIPQKPNGDDFEEMDERDWERVRAAVISYFS